MNTSIINSKSILASKTFIVNALVLIAGITTEVLHSGFAVAHAPAFVSFVAILNMALRFVSKQPVTLTGNDPVEVQH